MYVESLDMPIGKGLMDVEWIYEMSGNVLKIFH